MGKEFDEDVREFSNRKMEFINYCKYCAKSGNADALLFLEEFLCAFVNYRTEEYEYLNLLTEKGYIWGFFKLGRCYQYGLGCNRDLKKAMQSYLSGIIYTGDENCRRYLRDLLKGHKELGELKGITKDLISKDEDTFDMARFRLAERIYQNDIKEIKSENACLIYKELFGDAGFWYFDDEKLEDPSEFGSKAYLNFANCILYESSGFENPYAARYIAKEGLDRCNAEITYCNCKNSKKIEVELNKLIEEIDKEYGIPDDIDYEEEYNQWSLSIELFKMGIFERDDYIYE